jgi:hypothetical protein
MRRMKSHPASALGLLAILLLTSAVAVPQQAANRYTVEIVVFRNGGETGAVTEGGVTAATVGGDVEPVTTAIRKLGTAANRLRATSGFRVLAHTAWAQAPTSFNSRRGVSAARLGLTGAGVTGKIMLERAQYLHLGIDLTIEDGGRRYRITEVRRVKADETQYFDHPAVGVLALVTAGG